MVWLGIFSFISSLLIIPLSLIDPILSILFSWFAIISGGISSTTSDNKKLFYSCLTVSWVSISYLNMYTAKGFAFTMTINIPQLVIILVPPTLLSLLIIFLSRYVCEK